MSSAELAKRMVKVKQNGFTEIKESKQIFYGIYQQYYKTYAWSPCGICSSDGLSKHKDRGRVLIKMVAS